MLKSAISSISNDESGMFRKVMLTIMSRSNVMLTVGIGSLGRMELTNAITHFMLEF